MKKEEILPIGGGVIGVCSAYYLAAAGKQATLIEKDEICAGCSYGNAGLIVPSHSIPLAAPGVLAKALKWMLNGESPLYIRPRFDFELFPWLAQFGAACNESRVRKALPLLRNLRLASLRLFQQLSAIRGLKFGYQQKGLLAGYEDSEFRLLGNKKGKLSKDAGEGGEFSIESKAMLLSRGGYEEGLKEADLLREFSIESKALNPAEVRQPTSLSAIAGGVYFPQDAQLLPAEFVRGLAQAAKEMGVKICTSTEVLEFGTSSRQVSTVKTTRGDFWPDHVVLAAGAWSPILTRDLQIKLPIQAAKGYSVTVKRLATCPRIPLMLSEAKVASTPMGDTLRVAGTLEMAGLDLSVNRRRLGAITRAVSDYITGTDSLELIEVWCGLRPCTPDGLPIIGRPDAFQNLIVATGHGMLGMSLGPITGKLVSQLVSDEIPQVDLTALRVDRFS